MPFSPTAPGNPAGGTPAPPLDPPALNHLLVADPPRAARILAAMRPYVRAAQARAHADLCGVGADLIAAEWERLIARASSPLARASRDDGNAAPYAPEHLALLEAETAQELIAALGPKQRAAQAAACAHWLRAFGYPVDVADILAMWNARAAE